VQTLFSICYYGPQNRRISFIFVEIAYRDMALNLRGCLGLECL
jgi:hypothetical protein